MKNVEIVLKSCPFCGGKGELYGGVSGRGFVECIRCHVATDVDWVEEVVRVWNRRVSEVGMNCCKCNVGDGRL